MLWFIVGLLIGSTRGGGRWTFLRWLQESRNNLRQEEYSAELELERTGRGRPKDLAP